MKKSISLLLFFSLFVSCEKGEESKCSMVGEWYCRELDVKYTFPENGIIEHIDYENGWEEMKYQLIDRGDSLQIIRVNYDNTAPERYGVVKWIRKTNHRIHFYTNDIIMIENFCGNYWCEDEMKYNVILTRIKL